MGKEALGKGDNGDGLVFEAVGGAALGAGEMDVVEVMGIVATAEAVLLDAWAIGYFVEQVVLGEEAEGTEDAGAFHVGKPWFNIGKGECLGAVLNGAIDKDAVCCWTNVVVL